MAKPVHKKGSSISGPLHLANGRDGQGSDHAGARTPRTATSLGTRMLAASTSLGRADARGRQRRWRRADDDDNGVAARGR